MNYETLHVEDGDIVTLTINRPSARNALSGLVLAELHDFLRTASKPMILTGAAGPAFVAGADIREMATMTPAEGEEFGRLGQTVMNLLENVPAPVIACVDGYALGGGCELAMAADFIYATSTAVFGQPEVLLGLIPGFGGCVRLQQLVGPGLARELIYSGRKLEAAHAQRIGLVNEVFDTRQDMLAAAARTLGEIAVNSPAAVALCKAAINGARGENVHTGLELEATAFRQAFTTSDMREGTEAFLAKRTPVFQRA